jgi:hypothetical protein
MSQNFAPDRAICAVRGFPRSGHHARPRGGRSKGPPTVSPMTRLTAAVLGVLTLVVIAALALVLVGVRDRQQEQERELSRLTECVSILERNQMAPPGEPIMGCPIS